MQGRAGALAQGRFAERALAQASREALAMQLQAPFAKRGSARKRVDCMIVKNLN